MHSSDLRVDAQTPASPCVALSEPGSCCEEGTQHRILYEYVINLRLDFPTFSKCLRRADTLQSERRLSCTVTRRDFPAPCRGGMTAGKAGVAMYFEITRHREPSNHLAF
ncbi:hypothetical protein JOB18_008628 [Solea senegalensis]|uniref:Uncharacterized protein n=1 Tax=Solea senegalensis TaxID=28829 RepID=A0AAV6SD03_SOLSE|nr:hypothetical protein JOB18_008628 [Solea senegalensis]